MSGQHEGKRPSTSTQPMGTPTPAAWPGKRALTDRLSAPPQMAQGTRVTGIPIVDQGLACDDAETIDQPMAPECWLSALERVRLVGVGGDRGGRAHTNFSTQVAAKRIEILCQRESGWGTPAWVLFEVFTGNLIGAFSNVLRMLKRGASNAVSEGVMRAALGGVDDVRAIAEIGARMNPETAIGPLKAIAGMSRFTIRDHVKRIPPRAAGKAEFLLAFAAAGDAFIQQVTETLPAGLDDDALLLLVEALHPDYHSQAVYSAAIEDVLARYDAGEIGYIGKSWEHNPTELYASDYERPGRLDVVRFTHDGRTRSALVENRATMQRMDDADPGAPKPLDMRALHHAQWVRWLDADLAGPAAASYQARVGAPLEIEATEAPPALMPFVSLWLAGGE